MPLKPMMYVMAALCLAFSAWGTSTAIAIFLRRRWARISMLVFAGFLAFMNAGAMLFTLLAQLLAVFQNRPAEMAGWVAVGFTGVLAALGVWWLALFNRSRSKEYFEVEEAIHERARPLSISVIALVAVDRRGIYGHCSGPAFSGHAVRHYPYRLVGAGGLRGPGGGADLPR